MSSVSLHLNFDAQTENAFNFYKSVFGTEFEGQGIMRMSDAPLAPDAPLMSEEDKKLVMHVCLPILNGFKLMGTDAPQSMGFDCLHGNALYINLETDTRQETDQLFAKLSAGGKVSTPMQDQFWGAYYGSLTDKFGVNWMFNCHGK